MVTAVLFDLDGTLLPMDQEAFTRDYFRRLTGFMAPHGYEPRELIDAVWAGTAAMVQQDGTRTNEAVFWQVFAGIYGEKALGDQPLFDAFYRADFQQVRRSCGFQPMAAQIMDWLKCSGIRRVLATNPIFPAVSTESRIRWAGLEPSDFELVTTYENTRFCKPNPAYYREVLDRLGLSPEECRMVGNDAVEDLAARQAGIPVFLLTDCLIDREGRDLTDIPHGGFPQLAAWLAEQAGLEPPVLA